MPKSNLPQPERLILAVLMHPPLSRLIDFFGAPYKFRERLFHQKMSIIFGYVEGMSTRVRNHYLRNQDQPRTRS